MGAVVVLVLATAYLYARLAWSDQYLWFDHWDMCSLEIPRLSFIARSVQDGEFPFWDPHTWSGQPVIGQSQPGPLYPANLLLYLLPLRDGVIDFRILNWYYIAIHCQAALGAYFLCRHLNRSRLASIFAGCAFAFGGFVGTIPWLDILNGAVWAPLALLFALRLARPKFSPANAAWLGLVVGTSWLSGHHEAPLLITAMVGCVGVAAIARRPGSAAVRFAAAALVAGLVRSSPLFPRGASASP
jgi:hypothetical protein